jgi:hypothetical protein
MSAQFDHTHTTARFPQSWPQRADDPRDSKTHPIARDQSRQPPAARSTARRTTVWHGFVEHPHRRKQQHCSAHRRRLSAPAPGWKRYPLANIKAQKTGGTLLHSPSSLDIRPEFTLSSNMISDFYPFSSIQPYPWPPRRPSAVCQCHARSAQEKCSPIEICRSARSNAHVFRGASFPSVGCISNLYSDILPSCRMLLIFLAWR